jgi:hypothetical protein
VNAHEQSNATLEESNKQLLLEKNYAKQELQFLVESTKAAKNHTHQAHIMLQDYQKKAEELQEQTKAKVRFYHDRATECTRNGRMYNECTSRT